MTLFHATAVAIEGQGILITGPSGAGKSDLALRLIEDGAELIADDQVEVALINDELVASAPRSIFGLLEVRGIGVIKMAARKQATLHLIVAIEPSKNIERMPRECSEVIENKSIPKVTLDPFETSATSKLKMALRILAKEVTLLE